MNTHRYLARFIIETTTPVAIGSGSKGPENDRLVVKDWNNLPYIPGTSFAGVIRHILADSGMNNLSRDTIDDLFGNQEEGGGRGSRIIFSPGFLVGPEGSEIPEGLCEVNTEEDYLASMLNLPQRDHVRISDKGATDPDFRGKFDEQLVFTGTRFMFEIELEGSRKDLETWRIILDILHDPVTRIGAGTRKGFGAFKVVECFTKEMDLKTPQGLDAYLAHSSSMNQQLKNWSEYSPSDEEHGLNKELWIDYEINIEPESFFIFGAGYGDPDADMVPKLERIIKWKEGKPELVDRKILVPASSVKGAVSHRVAFHYNRIQKKSIETTLREASLPDVEQRFDSGHWMNELEKLYPEDAPEEDSTSPEWEKWQKKIMDLPFDDYFEHNEEWKQFRQKLNEDAKVSPLTGLTGENNPAVKTLFGYSKSEEEGARGNIIFSDVYLSHNPEDDSKVMDHLAVDRFTGGGIDGALYQEKVVTSEPFILKISVAKRAFEDQKVKEAFEAALHDLVNGYLPLGGNVNKGHGIFKGKYSIKNQ